MASSSCDSDEARKMGSRTGSLTGLMSKGKLDRRKERFILCIGNRGKADEASSRSEGFQAMQDQQV